MLDLGLERAGMRVLWQCESDPYCRAVLRQRWPGVPCYDDVRHILRRSPGGTAADQLRSPDSIDLLAGGFPCQPVSNAGRRAAQADERWLWPEFDRLVGLLRPRYVLVENVPGLLVRGMGEVLGDLAARGYDAEWECVGACALGATMHRERVWLLAYANDARLQGPVWAGKPNPPRAEREVAHSEPLRSARGLWPPGPGEVTDIPRMADGPTNRRERLRALGNTVVPQIPEWIGRRIIEAEGEAA